MENVVYQFQTHFRNFWYVNARRELEIPMVSYRIGHLCATSVSLRQHFSSFAISWGSISCYLFDQHVERHAGGTPTNFTWEANRESQYYSFVQFFSCTNAMAHNLATLHKTANSCAGTPYLTKTYQVASHVSLRKKSRDVTVSCTKSCTLANI